MPLLLNISHFHCVMAVFGSLHWMIATSGCVAVRIVEHDVMRARRLYRGRVAGLGDMNGTIRCRCYSE